MNAFQFGVRLAAGALVVCGLARLASAATMADFNSGTIVADFLFDDPVGTSIPDTFNSGTLGGSFDSDTDTTDVATNGSGQLDASGKDNINFGSNYVDLPTYTSGRLIGLFDVSWDFDEGVYSESQDEEFRLSLIANDPRSSFITAQTFFRRTSETEVALFGEAIGDAAVNTPTVVFGSSGSLLTLIELDIQSRVFEVSYSSDGGASFTSIGTGLSGDFDDETPEIDVRPVSSLRLVLNEDFSDDSLLVERFALSYIPEPSALLLTWMAGLVLVGRRARFA